MTQNLILQTLRSQANRDTLLRPVELRRCETRGAIGREVCRQFGFRDRRGRLQVSGCQKALRTLEGEGVPVLPPPGDMVVDRTPIRFAEGVPAAVNVPPTPAGLGPVGVTPVRTRGQRRLRNSLIAQEHPRGMTTFAGHQLRYLMSAPGHGYPGAAGFSASALKLSAREAWMGWNAAQRREYLDRVIGLSRFPIGPDVRCRHPASHAPGRILRRLGPDFEARYGFRPWLVETFVSPDQAGTSLRAANFLRIGRTGGRGRQDRHRQSAETVKTVYMCQPDPAWRRHPGLPERPHAPVPGR